MCTFSLGQRAVSFKGARIAGEILIGSELRGVDEDADSDPSARSRRCPNQGRMPRVQSAHGGDQADRLLPVSDSQRDHCRNSAAVRRISISAALNSPSLAGRPDSRSSSDSF
jgi:hypothetical protein